MNQLGVMQGRLLPKYKGRYQAHPMGYWQDEFPLATEMGLDSIEFILDYEDFEKNPLMNEMGLEEILAISTFSGIQVKSICADYFMTAPLHNAAFDSICHSQDILKRLIVNGAKIGVKDIVIPCVDQSSLLHAQASVEQFVANLQPIITLAEYHQVNLALETDLAPEPFAELLHRVNSARITVNYDTGNSAALGYDVRQEFAAYGSRISDIHIKDRIKNGGSVLLGTGDTDFAAFFSVLAKTNYTGPVILQAYRDDEGLAIFKQQLAWYNSQVA